MEVIIFIAVVVVVAVLWTGHVKATNSQAHSKIDDWKPFGHKIDENKPNNVVPGKSADDRVEAPAPTVANVTADNKAVAVAAVKKTRAKTAAKKKST